MGRRLMTRYEDWPRRLREIVTARSTACFIWGQHDCALFAADAVQAQTGIDLAASYRGRYRSASGSIRALKRYGAGTLEASVTECLGDPVDSRQASRGDVVLFESCYGPTLSICMGAVSVAPGPDGLVSVPMDKWVMAWRV